MHFSGYRSISHRIWGDYSICGYLHILPDKSGILPLGSFSFSPFCVCIFPHMCIDGPNCLHKYPLAGKLKHVIAYWY